MPWQPLATAVGVPVGLHTTIGRADFAGEGDAAQRRERAEDPGVLDDPDDRLVTPGLRGLTALSSSPAPGPLTAVTRRRLVETLNRGVDIASRCLHWLHVEPSLRDEIVPPAEDGDPSHQEA